MAFNTPLSSFRDISDAISVDEGDDEEEYENYDIQEAFDKIFLQSVDLKKKKKKQLKREIKKLTLKSNSLEELSIISNKTHQRKVRRGMSFPRKFSCFEKLRRKLT